MAEEKSNLDNLLMQLKIIGEDNSIPNREDKKQAAYTAVEGFINTNPNLADTSAIREILVNLLEIMNPKEIIAWNGLYPKHNKRQSTMPVTWENLKWLVTEQGVFKAFGLEGRTDTFTTIIAKIDKALIQLFENSDKQPIHYHRIHEILSQDPRRPVMRISSYALLTEFEEKFSYITTSDNAPSQ